VLDELRTEGRRVLASAGVPPASVQFRYGIDARYTGQGNEITVWVGEGDTWPATDTAVRERFDAEYEHIYGLTIPDVGIEAVTWRLSAYAEGAAVEPATAPPAAGDAAPHRHRPVVFTRGEGAEAVPVYRRATLPVGARFAGPAIVEERETTIVIRPGWSAAVGADGSITAIRAARASPGDDTAHAKESAP
jgi:N-methylhydantoinase A